MNRLLAALGLLAALAWNSAALAQPYNWSGFHVGASAGYGWGASNQTDPGFDACTFFALPSCSILLDGHYGVRGAAVGGGLGYGWQSAAWVFGVDGDFSWTGISGHSDQCSANFGVPHQCGTKLEDLGTLRAKLGYAPGIGNWLIYATGGLAGGEVKGWDNLLGDSGSTFRTGWTAGAGLA